MANLFRNRGLTFKQAFLTLAITLLIGALLTAMQSIVSLQAEREDAERRMAELIDAAQGNAEAAAFRLDRDLAGYVTSGLASYPTISDATIYDENGEVLATRSDSASPGEWDWLAATPFDEIGPVERALFGLGRPEQPVGRLVVNPDTNALAQQFLSGYGRLMALDAAKAILLAVVLSIIFYYALTLPLLRLAAAVRDVEPGKQRRLQRVERLRGRHDELGNLVASFEAQLVLFERLLKERGALLDELRLRNAALSSMDSGVLIVDSQDPALPFVDANPAIEKIVGLSREQIIGRSYRDLVESDKRSPEEMQRITEFATEGLTGDAVSDVFEIFHPDGHSMWCKMSIVPVFSQTGQATHRLVLINDITEARATEEMLRHSQKMDALGKVTGGIAHDFNNILAIVKGNLELLSMEQSDQPGITERLQPVTHSVDRASELTRRLLRFSRKVPVQESEVNIDALIINMGELLKSSLTPEIRIELQLAVPDVRVRLDPGDFEDALLNLALNARDAMPNGGTLTLKTEISPLAEGSPYLRQGMEPGNYVTLCIKDTGFGMDETTCERLFEPFFTTKDESRGTGLGLAQVYGFVERSKGNIRVTSEPGIGSTFSIFLPALAKAEPTSRGTPEPADLPRGSETILVVDDEKELLTVAEQILTALGYTPLLATSPAEAVALFREQRDEIDLLLSDVVMPGGMNGYELADTLVQEKPSLKVLMVSGYDSKFNGGGSRWPLLSKPYSMASIAVMLRKIITTTGDDDEA